MAVGAFASYNFMLRVRACPLLLPSRSVADGSAGRHRLRPAEPCASRAFYLAVATLAAQFFIVGLTKVSWFSNDSSSGVITAQDMVIFGYKFASPQAKYLLVLTIVAALALMAKNMARSTVGRAWMAVRDMDVAAEVIGIRIMAEAAGLRHQLLLLRRRRALYAYAYLGTVEPEGFNLDLSFQILFAIIIGGVGSIRVLPRCGLHRAAADLPRRAGAGCLHRHAAAVDRVEPAADGLRRPDHLLPDRRTARAGPALADRARRNCWLWPFPTSR